tara:strand:+ start:215 stop:625 length:411 start_codon:yes stop_codon:yes gene_type:complete
MPPTPKRYVTAMFPLKITRGGVGFDQISREDLVSIINQHLEFLLFTRPGEVISDIEFGVGLEDYVFLQENEPRMLSLESTITNHISKYLGYLTSFRVIVSYDQVDYNAIQVQVRYLVENLDAEQVAEFIVGPDVVR